MATNKDDVILRGKALKDLRAIKDVLVAQGDPFLASIMNRAIECIENQPAVETNKKGRWEKRGIGITERIACTNCGSHKGYFGFPPFCSQCGASMEGGTDNG